MAASEGQPGAPPHLLDLVAGRTVRAVWLDREGAGATADYWESLWAEEKADPPPQLLRAIERHLPQGGRVLESGCGQGEYVRLLERPGRTVVGADQAHRALARAHRDTPTLLLATADVSRLPFPDGAFDAILSLGVVEHFEAGPSVPLSEQRRLLAPEGRLILTVPQRSWLRAGTDLWHLGIRRQGQYREGRRRTITHLPRPAPSTGPGAFHQYELSRRQLRRYLESAGFAIERWEGFDVGTALSKARSGRRTEAPASPTPSRPGTVAGPRGARARLRRVLLTDDPVGPVGRAGRSLARRTLGHLHLVVARPA